MFRPKVGDSTDKRLSGGMLLLAALVLSRLIRRAGVVDARQSMIGVLLPPSAGAVLANLAIGLNRKVVVNLSYALTAEQIEHCVRTCGITHVITSQRFLKRKPLELPAVKMIFMEDLEKQATWFDKLIAALQAYCMPLFLLQRILQLNSLKDDDLMTVLFTSGTTGPPKGVMLSNKNVLASVDAIRQLYRIDRDDVTLGILPFFHAFGYSGTLWLPLMSDMAVVYHYDPFSTKAISKLAAQSRVTVLFATPTFLRLYLRRCKAEDFQTLDLAIVGAEKLEADLAVAFSEKFGATPVEGYGTTELSPWVAVNVPLHRSLHPTVEGSRPGTVGRPVPGVEVRVVDPETLTEEKSGQIGLLQVKGPTVMLGYLDNPEKTSEVIRDGWYNTGDFVRIDDEGFIAITGRQSRFSKIGGETVPHERIEQLIATVVLEGSSTATASPATGSDSADSSHPIGEVPITETPVVVTAIPDAKKGERLIVVYQTLGQHTPSEVIAQLSKQGLPNLWLPRPNDFVHVETIPLTSMGKVDLGQVREIACERSASSNH
ncbi:Bifunctional protein Aas [Aureliella helgolandensis]|uniref:Bifunctional protein Aas n=2 Tax=Aureliella helgolandensis TaxID=2527968 RepID=A0A518G886_9BACT|nr:Bifunctional protein Aas [Aureliella helgolandensis]